MRFPSKGRVHACMCDARIDQPNGVPSMRAGQGSPCQHEALKCADQIVKPLSYYIKK